MLDFDARVVEHEHPLMQVKVLDAKGYEFNEFLSGEHYLVVGFVFAFVRVEDLD